MGMVKINRPGDPATPKQVNYLDALSKEMVTLAARAVNNDLENAQEYADAAQDVVNALAAHDTNGTLTKGGASDAIDFIVDSNRKIKAAIDSHKSVTFKEAYTPSATTTSVRRVFGKDDAGVYVNADGSIYRVYFGQQSGQMLCKEVVGKTKDDFAFVYKGLAERYVTGTKLPLDEAKAWGKATETCIACGRKLDVPESVDAGIGPVCAGKF